jgi:hypothetical protein
MATFPSIFKVNKLNYDFKIGPRRNIWIAKLKIFKKKTFQIVSKHDEKINGRFLQEMENVMTP